MLFQKYLVQILITTCCIKYARPCSYSPSQSAPTILVLNGRFADLKKTGSKIWGAKSRVQKTGSMLFKKRKGQAVSSLFE